MRWGASCAGRRRPHLGAFRRSERSVRQRSAALERASDLTINQEWRETAGELSYLSIRLLDFVTALPTVSLPPRGRVPWSTAELTELNRLTHLLVRGEQDAERAASSMGAIDEVFQRPHSQMTPADAVAEAALLKGYIAHRASAMLSLPRLQRLGEARPGATSTARSAHRVPWWRAVLRVFRRQ